MASNTTLTDTTGQLPQVGSDLGGFLTNVSPGVVGFVFLIAIVSGILGLIAAVIFVIRAAMKKVKM